MFDIGFWELLVIFIVMMVAVGPERMPEVARKVAFLVRKLRESLFRLRSEMQSEIPDTVFEDVDKARQEMGELKNDLRQLGADVTHSGSDQDMSAITKKSKS